MSKKEILKNIILLAYPIIIENFLQVSMGFVDNYFVSRLGTESIAGVGVTNLIMNIYLSFFFAVGVGTTALVSRYIGEKESKKASVAGQQAFLLSIVLGLTFGLVNLVFYKQILMLMGLNLALIKTTAPYFLVITVPSIFLSMSIMISSALRGAKNTKSMMKISIVTNVINIILDPILIFGMLSIPGMGIIGAGIATSFSRLIGFLLLIRETSSVKSDIYICYRNTFKFDKNIMKNITRIGMPVAIERLFMRIGQLVYFSFIITLGTKVYAAYVVSGTLDAFAYLPGIGIGGAAATLVGSSLGAGKREDAYNYGMGALFIGMLFMVTIGLINFVFAPEIADIFTKDHIVKTNIVFIMRIMTLFQPLIAITYIITPTLQGAGDTKWPMVYTMIGIWLFRVLGCYLLVIILGYGISAVIFTVFLDLFLRSILLWFRFKKRKWLDTQIY